MASLTADHNDSAGDGRGSHLVVSPERPDGVVARPRSAARTNNLHRLRVVLLGSLSGPAVVVV